MRATLRSSSGHATCKFEQTDAKSRETCVISRSHCLPKGPTSMPGYLILAGAGRCSPRIRRGQGRAAARLAAVGVEWLLPFCDGPVRRGFRSRRDVASRHSCTLHTAGAAPAKPRAHRSRTLTQHTPARVAMLTHRRTLALPRSPTRARCRSHAPQALRRDGRKDVRASTASSRPCASLACALAARCGTRTQSAPCAAVRPAGHSRAAHSTSRLPGLPGLLLAGLAPERGHRRTPANSCALQYA